MSGPTPGQPPGSPDAHPAGLGPPPQGDPWPGAAQPQAYPPTPAGYGAAPGYPPYPPPARGTDGFAIAALIFSIIGWVLLSIVFGFVALSRIKRTGQGGRGLAIAALVISGVWIVLIAVAIVFLIATGATGTTRGPSGDVVAAGSESVSDLQAGDCLTDPPTGTDQQEIKPNASVSAVPCNQPHTGEVFGVFDLPAGPYPGPAEVDRQVGAGCNDRLASYSPAAVTDPAIQIYTVYPLESSWKIGDREVMCIAGSDTPTTGSIRGR